MAAKRKPAKKSKPKTAKPAAKPAPKKTAKKSAKKSVVRTAAKPAKREGLHIKTDPALEARLRMLATKLGKDLPGVIVQALNEFADNWEDHMQTVQALKDTEDRVHLTVPKE